MARKVARSHPAGAPLLLLVLSTCFIGRGVAQDAPPVTASAGVSADELRSFIPPNVAASALNVLNQGKIATAARAIAAPTTALALSSAAASALGFGVDVAGAAGDVGLALGGAGLAATAALQKKVDTIEKILLDCVKTKIAIQSALESVAGDVAVRTAMAPYRQCIAALNLLREAVAALAGPGGLTAIFGSLVGGLASPTAGVPALIASTVRLLGTVVANPAAAGIALVQATTAALGPVRAALVAAGNTLVGRARAVIAPLAGFAASLLRGAVVAGGSIAAAVLGPGGVVGAKTKLIMAKIMALKGIIGPLGVLG